MRLFKFKQLFLLTILSVGLQAFTGNECLNSNFQVNISHQGKPFGLTQVNLEITKAECTITVRHEKLKYLKKSWSIDVCREPIHIKKNGGSDVLKKINDCVKKSGDDFCLNKEELLTVIQDDALIFAEGEKEKINTNHGKSYCSYLLLKQYLDNSKIFNRGQDYSKLFENGYSQSGKQETQPSLPEVIVPRPVVEGVEASDAVESSEETKPVELPKEKANGVGTY